MPQTLNGIGTWYYGKKNVKTQAGVCPKCHREVNLESFDTRLWFVVVFIPVIPLGKKRVMDKCPRCGAHRVMPLDKYNEVVEETLDRLGAQYRGGGDAEAAIAYVAALLEFDRRAEAEEELGRLAARFASDARVNLFVGGSYEKLDRMEEAGRHYDKAFSLDPSFRPARVVKALKLMVEGRPDEARRLLDFMMGPSPDQDPSVLLSLARAYQKMGGHNEALEIFRVMIRDFPVLGQDKAVRKAVQASEKAAPGPMSVLPPKKLKPGKTAAAAAIIILIVAALAGYDYYRGRRQKLYVLSAYPGQLRVALDSGAKLSFDGPGRQEIELSQGKHEARVSGPFEEAIPIDMGSGLAERHGSAVRVLNPGGLGVMLWENTLYSEKAVTDFAGYQYRFYAGKEFLVLSNVDYPFRDFPREIQLSERQSEAMKTRVIDLNYSAPGLAGAMIKKGQAGDCVDYLENWLRLAPADNLPILYYWAANESGQTRRAAAFLKPGLSFDPVNVEWHRAYQMAANRKPEDAAMLAREYDGYLEKYPGNSSLLYLRARIEPDPDQALGIYGRALAADPMNWYALNGRAYTRMGRADFQEAIADLRLAMLASKGDRGIIEQYLKLRLAKGDPTEVEQELRGQVEGVKPAEVDWGAASCLVQLLGAQGRDQEAGDLMERLANIAKKLDPDHAQSYSGRLRADYLYARGKIKELCLLAKGQGANSSGEEPALWCAFASGQPARAEGIISQPADFARHNIGSLELLLSLLYQQKNDMAAAKKWEKKALDKYIKWEPSMVLFKEMMQGSAPVTAVNLERLSLAPDDRAVALTALALARPESRNMLLEEAKRFNLPPAFPCRFLNSFQQ